MSLLEFKCPHCQLSFVVLENEINCGIFRHFRFFNGNELSPHASREECEQAVQQGGWGCAKPLRILRNGEGVFIVEVCEYI